MTRPCEVVVAPGAPHQRMCGLPVAGERDGRPVCLDHLRSRWELPWSFRPVPLPIGAPNPTRMALVETETRA